MRFVGDSERDVSLVIKSLASVFRSKKGMKQF